jgi:beta-fructofuranosidase
LTPEFRYDQKTDSYHLFYQSFPNHMNGGNGSWGHAVSQDLITWQDIHGWSNREAIALQPGPYHEVDWVGAWTGGAVPVSLDGRSNGNLTIFYTCVSKFPVDYTEPEPVGAEKQCIATSSDGGATWQKYSGNSIMDLPPAGWNITGWRDPYVRAIPELDAILGVDVPQYYMVLGSGIKGVGPRIPLYSANATDLTQWKFLGALFELPENYSSTGDASVSGSFGFNIEVAGFFPLREEKVNGGDGQTTHFAIHVGTEGGVTDLHTNPHWTMFALGSVYRRSNGSAEMSLSATGPLDWGNFYAANSFWDPKHDRQVIWGWSDESFEMPVGAYRPQGYQGSLSLPRELFVKKASGLLPPSSGIQNDPAHWERTGNGSYTVTTLGTRPLSDVVTAIQGSAKSFGSLNVRGTHRLRNIASDHFHLHAAFQSFPSSGEVGFIVRESPNKEE